jgi:hypothetical protein
MGKALHRLISFFARDDPSGQPRTSTPSQFVEGSRTREKFSARQVECPIEPLSTSSVLSDASFRGAIGKPGTSCSLADCFNKNVPSLKWVAARAGAISARGVSYALVTHHREFGIETDAFGDADAMPGDLRAPLTDGSD